MQKHVSNLVNLTAQTKKYCNQNSFFSSFLVIIFSLGLLFCIQPAFAQNNQQYNFIPSDLKGVELESPTSLQFGPDKRLYVAQQDGIIKIFTIKRNAPNDYSVIATEVIDNINRIPNHNDDGTLAPLITKRQVTGILVKGTPAQPLLYVTSSDSRTGAPGDDFNIDNNSSMISLLTKTGSVWQKVDLVRGLPRSEENHAAFGMQLDDKTNMMYVVVGGLTNAGSPSHNFAYATEFALSACILSVNLNVINALPTKGSGDTAYKYDIPTVDDPTRINNPDGSDINDPFGGNDGLNQGKIVAGGPVQVYASGLRNPYDLVLTVTPGKAGRMYTIDNGGNQGWGGFPANEGRNGTVTNNYVAGEPGSTGPGVNDPTINNLDALHYIGNTASYLPGSYYGGHPNPIRANPAGAGLYTHDGTTGVWRTTKTGPNPLPADWPPVPVNMAHPIEGDFQLPGVSNSALLTFATSTNGMVEYTASNFNGALKGTILAADLNFGKIFNLNFNADGSDVTNLREPTQKLYEDVPFAAGFGTEPLDITAQGDSAIFPGTVWTCTYKTQAITIFEPQDFFICSGLDNGDDDDSDGYTNADEIDNGTHPCSAASKPNDLDRDQISDLNDPDDDNDGIGDNVDLFPIDPTNGLTLRPPVSYNLYNNDPGTGFYGLGFTGLMSNKLPGNDYIKNFNEDSLIAGGAVGAFSVVATTQGDCLGSLNNQQNAFQFGVKAETGTGPFTVNARLSGPFFNNKIPVGAQSQGIYIGTGDQSNYLKVVLNDNAGAMGIQVVHENGDVPVSQQFAFTGGITSTNINLFLSVNPVTGTVQPKYSFNGGTVIELGVPIVLTGALLNAIQGPAALAVGVISTSRGASSFVATWDYIYVSFDPIVATGVWNTMAPVSGKAIAREGNAYIEAGDKFYLIGGRGVDSVQAYDPMSKVWQNKSRPPMELLDFQAVTQEGLIYVAGAFTGTFPRETPVSQVYIFNPLTDKWFAGSTIPAARRRGSTGTVVYKNKIYMIGGIQDGHWTGFVNWLDEYDPVTNTWKTMPDAPRVRDHFHATVINDKLYVAGGRRSSGITSQAYTLTIPEIDVFDFSSGLWSTLPAARNLPTPRAGAATAVLGNELLIIGGESAQATANLQTEAYNLETNTWRRLADLQQRRHGTQVIESNNGLYIVAGAASQGSTNLVNSQESFYLFNPTVPDITALSQSQLTPIPSQSFGSLPINLDSTKVITLNNTGGNQAILISSINITGASSFSSTTPYALPFILSPGKSININVKFKPAVSGTQTATLVIQHSGQGGVTNTSLSGAGNTPVYLINAGGGPVVTSIGSFGADAYFSPVPGNTHATSSAISGTTDDVIYQSERFNSEGAFNYAFPVSNGQYTVVLHFAEIFFTAPGNRIFDVMMEGSRVLDNYDIVRKAGAFSATTESFLVNVTDGTLNLSLSSLSLDGGTNSPKISAIEIQRASNQAPASSAGPDKTITLPVNSVSLNGSGSDADGSIAGFSWVQVSGPNTAVFSNLADSIPTISGLIEGTYVFSLVVTDNLNTPSPADLVTVTVSSAPNQVPLANAGADKALTLPANSTTLNGSGADIDGTIAGYIWSQVSGPSTAGISSKIVAAPAVTGMIAGTYVFNLIVVDNQGAQSAADQVTIIVSPAINQLPVANAGPDKTVTLPSSTTTLNGVASDADGSVASVTWTQVSGPNTALFNNKNILEPTVGGLIAGTYVFSLMATDNQGAPGSGDQVTITVSATSNQAPLANAGADKTISLPVSTTLLNGSGTDMDGTISNYSWTQVSGPVAATFSSLTEATPSISGLVAGTYVFSLLVTDNEGTTSAVDQVMVIVNPATNQPPVSNAGIDKTVSLPVNSIGLSGSGTDADGTIAGYTWSQVSGPGTAVFSSLIVATPTVSGLVTGTYVFSLVVTDNLGAQGIADSVQVSVNSPTNSVPVANAGADKTITLPVNSTVLNGSGSDADGTVTGYKWTQVSGPDTAVFNSFLIAAPMVSALKEGTYVFSLAVTDNLGVPGIADTVNVIVNPGINQIPVANAGADKTIFLPTNNVNLTGSGIDPDGTVAAYTWTQVSGPNTATFSNVKEPAPTVSSLVAGTYVFSLVVTDNQGKLSIGDQVVVTVSPASNQVPVANAGADRTIVLPVDSTVLTGLGTDADGTISSYNWEQVSGPNTALFSSANAVAPKVSGLIQGSYLFRLRVADNMGAFSIYDSVAVTVITGNRVPLANAGPDKAITLPLNSSALSGSGTDADGIIAGYTWSQVSGPTTAVFSSTTIAEPVVSMLSAGTYVFSLIVTDNMGSISAADVVSIIVASPANQIPLANAGADKSVSLPASSTVLTGSGTDADGLIAGYSWSQVSGPNTATFSSKVIASPTVSGLVQGTYVFSLAVTDTLGAVSAADLVNVVVTAITNELPVANAGVDKTITLPVNSTELSGSGTDADGTVSGFNWSQVSGPNSATFSSTIIANPIAGGLVAGSYIFRLIVTDNLGAVSTADQVIITVNSATNQLPVANAGTDKALALPTNSTTLTGSGSDADGTIAGYIWSQVSGPNSAVFNNILINAPTVSGMVAGNYVFSLVVRDNLGAMSTADLVNVVVSGSANQAPSANAGADQSITLPNSSATLGGSGTDADGTISEFAWTQVSGPNTATFNSKLIPSPTISGLVAGTYSFSLVVTDNAGAASVADLITLVVSGAPNQLPVANAGPDITVSLPVSTATLAGSGTDTDGTIIGYTWTQVTGPNTATFSNKLVAAPAVSGLIAGTYFFSLVVTDNSGASSVADLVSVVVSAAANQLPVANAGADISVTLPVNNTTLAGSGTDADGTISTYTWTQVSGPNTATFNNKLIAAPAVTGLIAGTYSFSLVVTDNAGASSVADLVSVVVSAAANQLPVANAGADIAVTLPVNNTILAGTGTDADGTISTYTWTQVSGPNTATFNNKLIAAPAVSGLIAGTYSFSLVVTDNAGASSVADLVNVVVGSAANQSPVANAGADLLVTLPTATATLAGSGSDADGTVNGFTWTQVSGPNTATFNNKLIAAPSISGLIAGTYSFSLVVADNLGASSGADLVNVVVNAAPVVTPVYRINAGGPQVATSMGTFAADAFYSPVPGSAHSSSSAIAGTTDDALYQSERFEGSGTFGYAFPVTNGQYTVILHFAEIFFTTVNNRIFDVTVEGATVLDNYDIVRKAGSFTATTETFTAIVTDGVLNINLNSLPAVGGRNSPKISAIEILTTGGPNQAPVANAGTDKAVTLPVASTTLTGSGTDADGIVAGYSWTQVSGPNTATFNNKLIAAPVVSGLIAGTYSFSLVVTDNSGASSSADLVNVVVTAAANQLPVANAGADRSVALPASSTTLAGSGIDPDGSIAGYTWTQVSGPNTATFNNKLIAAPAVSGLIAGTYSFSLVVTDNSGASSAADLVNVVVSSAVNQSPVANAGADRSVILPVNSTTLAGSGTDADGTVSGFTWAQVSGPNTATFNNKLIAAPTVSGLVAGTYSFSLVVTDNLGASGAADLVTVVVNAAPVVTPVYRINAGGGQVTNSIGTFAADAFYSPAPGSAHSASDNIAGTTDDAIYQSERFDGAGTFGYAFPVTNGQYTVILHFAEIYFTTMNSRVFDVAVEGATVLDNYDIVRKAGSFTATTETFTATVTDGVLNINLNSLPAVGGRNSPKISAIEILTSGVPNQAPVANAGLDQTITLSAGSTMLTGSGTDVDGTVTGYTWTQVSGPNTAILINSLNATPLINGLMAGTYSFSLVVTDNSGASSAPDLVNVVVTGGVNQPPLANAGPDRSVALPASSTTLAGSGIDPDGSIAGYTWTQVSGPNTATFNNKLIAAPAVSGLIAGTYSFSLVVTDNSGTTSAADLVNVVVSSAVNQSPVANAGADRSVTLPVNSITLAGSGTDADGTVSGFTWAQVSGPNTATFNNKLIAAPTLSGLVAGTYSFSLLVTDNLGASGAADLVTVVVNAAPVVTPVYRINAGGGQVTNSIGTFAADAFYSPAPGSAHSASDNIAGTTDDAIYQSERFDGAGTFGYAFPVTNGQYTVILHFAEIYFTTMNSRIFDVTVEGATVLDNYDIVRKAGAFTAIKETFTATVTDGVLNINLSSLAAVGGRNSPKISAIEILTSGSQSLMAGIAPADGQWIANAVELDASVQEPLTVKIRPNPSSYQFTINIAGNNNQRVKMKVFNSVGVLVEEKILAANSSVILGSSYRPGLYFAEVVQGKKRVLLKFIKLSK